MYWTPGTTDYGKRVLYATYDITGLLEKENVFGVVVGPGWYGIPKLRFQAEIIYTDNTTEMITTGRNLDWKVTVGPIIKSSVYDGEYYDAREEKTGWDLVKEVPSQPDRTERWMIAVTTDAPGGKMVSQKLEPIKVMGTILPQSISEPVRGTYVIDAGRNLAGWASIKVKGERGRMITLKLPRPYTRTGRSTRKISFWPKQRIPIFKR